MAMSSAPLVRPHRATFAFAEMVQFFDELHPLLAEPQEVQLDFSEVKFLSPSGVVPLIAVIDSYIHRGWDFYVTLPDELLLQDYFEKAGWLAGIEGMPAPDAYTMKTFTPLARYENGSELNQLINTMMDVLSRVTEFGAGVLSAVEWTVNEIADNVLVHAQDAPGWAQVIARPKKGHIEVVVADCGPGIRSTLSSAYPEIRTDDEALRLAIEKGVTRDRQVGQGNGLSGSLRIAEKAKGWVNIYSGSANLRLFDSGRLDSITASPFPGTVVTITLPLSADVDVSGALWGYEPAGVFEFTHVSEEGVLFVLRDEASGFGNRASGEDLVNKLRNLAIQFPEERVIVDFSGIEVASASFLDEFVAKLVKREGVTTFFSRYHLRNMNELVRRTTDAVIVQRLGVE